MTLRHIWVSALPGFMFAGCSRLPPGRFDALTALPPARIVMIRGFLDWYSTGIDRLASELHNPHGAAVVFRDDQWHHVADALSKLPSDGPLVLIGFSYGADDVISIARQLCTAHQPVALLITIDPVTPGRVPGNVGRCVNYYESNGVWDIFPWLRGVPLTADNGARVENINIRHRADLAEPDTSHSTIAANPRVHEAIVRDVTLLRGRG